VVDDRGRAESFRRLRVLVGGPDGIAHSVPLEAVGAGAYSATLPLSRPGAYMATAIDEVSGEAVGIAGAALSAGEELKPTGSDRALLGRIAELTGGKVRDTLAGLYLDRPPRRFAYTPLLPWLVMTAAFALLFTVAARRLSPPERLARLPGDIGRARRARAERRKESAAEASAARHADLDALKRAKARSAAPTVTLPPHKRSAPPAAGSRAAQAPAAAAQPTAPTTADAGPHSASGRKLSAAEILLERRRKRPGKDS
jgi:hypothetical protein